MVTIPRETEHLKVEKFLESLLLNRNKTILKYDAKLNRTYNSLKKKLAYKKNNNIRLSPSHISLIIMISKEEDKHLVDVVEQKQNEFDTIVFKSCRLLKINVEALLTKNRKRELAKTRQAIWRFAYDHIDYFPLSKFKFEEIMGLYFGRDRTTVIHGIKTATNVKDVKEIYNILIKNSDKII